jgi:class 3 adenylate cyclase
VAENPKQLQSIAEWLEGLGLGAHADTFAENDITFDVLPDLTEDDLRALGLSLGNRKRLMRAIAQLGAKKAPMEAAPPPDPGPDLGGERRQVTLSFFDLVGSTEISTRVDAEDMTNLLSGYHATCREAITRYGGHVASYMGDGVLAYFGYPTAYEDAAERAVRASLDAISAMSKLRSPTGVPLAMRAGVATGVVVVGQLRGDATRRELAAIGDTPNLAARLQAAAQTGTVVIGASTRRLVGEVFDLENLGALDLKGFAEPVQAYRVGGLATDADRFLAHHAHDIRPLVGRATELAHLRARWDEAVAGRGRINLVVGEAGIGKSRLVRGLSEGLTEGPLRRIQLFCSPYHTNSAFWPAIECLQRAAGVQLGDTPENKLAKLGAVIRPAPSPGSETLVLIADLLGIGTSAASELTAEDRRQRTTAALVDHFLAGTQESPTLILLEDAHWLDPTTLELVTAIAERIAEARIMVLVTSRPGFDAPWSYLPQSDELRLNRLGRNAVESIITSVAGKPLPPEIIAEIVAKTDGVPLFVEELTKTVLESGIVHERGSRYEITRPMVPLSIPSTLQDSLTVRLDRLSSVKWVAQFAAAIGREFSYALLLASTNAPEGELRPALEQLAASQLVQRHGAPPNERYIFVHALVRDAAYRGMLREQRRHCHAAIATTMALNFPDLAGTQPELVAYHFDEADVPGEAVDWWKRAGSLSAHRSATSEAARQLRAAIAANARMPDSLDNRMNELELRIMLSGPLIALQGYVSDDLAENYARAWDLCETEEAAMQAFPVMYGQWVIPYVRGLMNEATKQGRRFLDRATAVGDKTLKMVGHRLYGSGLTWRGDPVEGARHLEIALGMFDPIIHDELAYIYSQHPRVSARAHLSFAEHALGMFGTAARTAEAAVAEAIEKQHFNSIAYALCFSALLFLLRRQRDEVDARAQELLTRSEEKSASYWVLWADVMLGWVRAADGDVAGGLVAIREPLSKLEAQGANVWVPQAQLIECELLAEQGRHSEAASAELAARALIVDAAQGYYLAELHRVSARRRALAGGSASEIAAALTDGLAEILARGARGHAMRLAATLGEHLLANGDSEGANAVLAKLGPDPGNGADTPDCRELAILIDRVAAKV